jgi:hypothetical protein
MTSWVTWGVFVVVAVALGVAGNYFSIRTLRLFTVATALVLVVAVTEYGLTHPASTPQAPQDLQTAFARGADAIAAALFHPVWLGDFPAPGRVGWIVLGLLLLIGYRQLESRAFRQQAPVIDTSQLDQGQPSIEADPAGVTDGQRHDQLAAELKFRLAAMEVRSPAILPGGSRTDGLASIAEDSGVTGAGLAGALIRYLGSLWPASRRFQLRFWVEPSAPPSVAAATSGHGTSAGSAALTGETRVTVELDDARGGVTVASKTVAAAGLNETASMVAGYIARQVFASDRSTPPWCYGASDGHDLGALLIARQERVYAENWDSVRSSRLAQIKILQTVTGGNRCAGVVRYELAQLHDLGSNHLTALLMHAINREQYPRFFRGRYRLGMSLEMAANRGLTFGNPAAVRYMLTEVLEVLQRCGLTTTAECTDKDIVASEDVAGHHRISDELSMQLLEAARTELRVIRRQLAFVAVLWAGLVRRSERTVWRPHRQLRYRQSFRDGACVAELLVAVRIQLNETENLRPVKASHYRHALRVAEAIAGDSAAIKAVLRDGAAAKPPPPKPNAPARTAPTRERVRRLPGMPHTASWQAAYNTACLYSVLAQHGLATEDRIVVSLQRAIDSKDSEMERPYDWISYDPDFLPLKASGRDQYPAFKKFLRDTKRRDYPRRPRPTDDPHEGDGTNGDSDGQALPGIDREPNGVKVSCVTLGESEYSSFPLRTACGHLSGAAVVGETCGNYVPSKPRRCAPWVLRKRHELFRSTNSSGRNCIRAISKPSAASRSWPARCGRSAPVIIPGTGCGTRCTSARAWCPPAWRSLTTRRPGARSWARRSSACRPPSDR